MVGRCRTTLATTGLSLVFVRSRFVSRSVRDLRLCSVGLMIKSGARLCRITDQRLGCLRAVLFSRQCSHTSASVWHRARPQQRSEEAAFGGAVLARQTFLAVSTPFSALSQANILQTIFTPFVVVQFHVVVSLFYGRVFGVCSFVSHGIHSFAQFSWLVVPLRRCVGKQTPAAPEVQLRDVVWSDESFSSCGSSPTIRTRESVG